MRLVILSYSHHGRGIGQTIRSLGHDIIGVMDGEEGPRQQLAEIFQCPGFATAGECLDATQPDAALVAGKHIEMPDHVQACVDRRIPYSARQTLCRLRCSASPRGRSFGQTRGLQRPDSAQPRQPHRCHGGASVS